MNITSYLVILFTSLWTVWRRFSLVAEIHTDKAAPIYYTIKSGNCKCFLKNVSLHGKSQSVKLAESVHHGKDYNGSQIGCGVILVESG